jgi:hypothetical protein
MNKRFRAAWMTALSTVVVGMTATAAHASVLSVLPGSCGARSESQPFLEWNDHHDYFPTPGGGFEAGTPAWSLTGGAAVEPGNETYSVAAAGDSRSLSLPAGSTATSPVECTDILDPTVRLFVRNTGSPASQLDVIALYPGLLGGVEESLVGRLTGSSRWEPSPIISLLGANLSSTLSLSRTVIAFRFVPADRTGSWQIDDVYVDPYGRG